MNGIIQHIIGVMLHKIYVFIFMQRYVWRLVWRSMMHDMSKFTVSEIIGFSKVTSDLKKSVYGETDYIENIKKIQGTIERHHKHNSHHPEYYRHGIIGMDLIDLIEMLSDWQASTKRHQTGNIRRSMIVNAQRFDIRAQLYRILRNTLL